MFLTGTRADYGKMKALIQRCVDTEGLEAIVAVTGMHCLNAYGSTWLEVRHDFPDAFVFQNQNFEDSAATTLSKTASRMEDLLREHSPDLLVIHGDRVETLAAAATGILLNTRVGHIEGGEVSGTVDESIRHAVSKLSHAHFVSNESAAERLRKLGESPDTIFTIGSPELDLAFSSELPSLEEVKNYYGIPAGPHAILAFHPVATSPDVSTQQIQILLQGLRDSAFHVVVIEPNNDLGSREIRYALDSIRGLEGFSIFPSIRYERFLVLLRSALLVVGNSSMGVREAPNYGVPSIDVGSRQMNRAFGPTILHLEPRGPKDVRDAIEQALALPRLESRSFGDGKSAERFTNELLKESFWQKPIQKSLSDD